MCQYEGITYACTHSKLRIWKHCHFARNDPNHQCFGAWTIEREVELPKENCPDCVGAGYPRLVNVGNNTGGWNGITVWNVLVVNSERRIFSGGTDRSDRSWFQNFWSDGFLAIFVGVWVGEGFWLASSGLFGVIFLFPSESIALVSDPAIFLYHILSCLSYSLVVWHSDRHSWFDGENWWVTGISASSYVVLVSSLLSQTFT